MSHFYKKYSILASSILIGCKFLIVQSDGMKQVKHIFWDSRTVFSLFSSIQSSFNTVDK